MNSTSPPVSVHATPVATPGRDVRNETSWWNRGGPEVVGHLVGVDTVWVAASPSSGRATGDARGDLAGDRADLPLEIAHARLARVLAR